VGCNEGRILLGFLLAQILYASDLEASEGDRDSGEDFIVVAGGEVKISFDIMSGSCVDVTVVHTEMR